MNFPELKTGVQPEFSAIYNTSTPTRIPFRGEYYNPDRSGTRDCTQETPCIQSIPVVIDNNQFKSRSPFMAGSNTLEVPKGTLVAFYHLKTKKGPRCVSQPDAVSRVVFLSDKEYPEDTPPNIIFPTAEHQIFTKRNTHAQTVSHVSVCVSGFCQVIVPASSPAFSTLPGDILYASVHNNKATVGPNTIGSQRFLLGRSIFQHSHKSTSSPMGYTHATVSLTPMKYP